jgi:hypothetical protein
MRGSEIVQSSRGSRVSFRLLCLRVPPGVRFPQVYRVREEFAKVAGVSEVSMVQTQYRKPAWKFITPGGVCKGKLCSRAEFASRNQCIICDD